jgi:hypothetical protein
LILLTGSEPVFNTDSLDIEEIIGFWDETVSAALADDDVTFVRLSAEATWWMTQLPTLDDIMRYEARLNSFAGEHPQSILCLYDIGQLGTGVVFDAMKLHRRIFVSGLVIEPVLRPE